MIVAISLGDMFQVSERNKNGTYTNWFMPHDSDQWDCVVFPSYKALMSDHKTFNDDILFNDDPNNV